MSEQQIQSQQFASKEAEAIARQQENINRQQEIEAGRRIQQALQSANGRGPQGNFPQFQQRQREVGGGGGAGRSPRNRQPAGAGKGVTFKQKDEHGDGHDDTDTDHKKKISTSSSSKIRQTWLIKSEKGNILDFDEAMKYAKAQAENNNKRYSEAEVAAKEVSGHEARDRFVYARLKEQSEREAAAKEAMGKHVDSLKGLADESAKRSVAAGLGNHGELDADEEFELDDDDDLTEAAEFKGKPGKSILRSNRPNSHYNHTAQMHQAPIMQYNNPAEMGWAQGAQMAFGQPQAVPDNSGAFRPPPGFYQGRQGPSLDYNPGSVGYSMQQQYHGYGPSQNFSNQPGANFNQNWR